MMVIAVEKQKQSQSTSISLSKDLINKIVSCMCGFNDGKYRFLFASSVEKALPLRKYFPIVISAAIESPGSQNSLYHHRHTLKNLFKRKMLTYIYRVSNYE